MTDAPWEPPLAGTETAHLIGALDRLRTTFRWKVDGLDAAGLQTRIGTSEPTLGGLLKHMAITEDFIFTRKLTGDPFGAPWEELFDGTDDWEFTSAARSRTRLADALDRGGLDQRVHMSSPGGEHASLRRLLREADLLREAVDGRVGEDPPPGWVPVSGR